MSYDLLVFNPEVAPRDRKEFMSWYQELTKWGEDRDYNSPDGLTGNLPAFYDTLRIHYPPMNGPHAHNLEPPQGTGLRTKSGLWGKLFGTRPKPSLPAPKFNEAFVTDYCIAENAIYLAFAWSISAEAYSSVVSTAISTGVGFFDVSASNGQILHDREQLTDLEIL